MTTATPTTAAPAVSTPAAPAPASAAPDSTPAVAASATPAPAAQATPAAVTPPEKPASDAPAAPAEQSLLKPPETKQDDTKPGDPAKAIPAEVEVKVPEGVEVNGALVDELKSLAKTNGMSSEVAQQVFDLGLKMQKSLAEDLDRSLEKYKTDSIASLRKEWGSKFDANVVAAQKVVNKFGDPKLLEELNGMENSPAVMRTLAAIGRALGEDSIAIPGAKSAPPPVSGQKHTGDPTIDALVSLYPSMNKD